MKEWLSKLCVHKPKEYILYFVICHSYNCQTTLQSAAIVHFSEKIKEKVFRVIEAINEESATNSIMNLCHTLHVIGFSKTLFSIVLEIFK